MEEPKIVIENVDGELDEDDEIGSDWSLSSEGEEEEQEEQIKKNKNVLK